MPAETHMPNHASTVKNTGLAYSDVPICQPPYSCPYCQAHHYSPATQKTDEYRYTKVVTDSEARVMLAYYVVDINEAQNYLRSAIEQHGDHIWSRWRKQTQLKCAALLKQAEPDLPESKGLSARIEYDGASSWQTQRETSYRKYHLLPYLNVETLVNNPVTFIGLVNTRATDSAEEWAPFDYEQIGSSWGLGLLDVEFHAGAVNMLGQKYGTLAEWEENAAHQLAIIGFPRARLVVEAQATLLKFLKRTVGHLLEGLSTNELGYSAKLNALITSCLKMTGDGACWSTFVNQPFTTPPRFGIDVLLADAKARLDVISDHMWLLETEQSYFKRYIRRIAQMQSVQSKRRAEMGLTIINAEIIRVVELNWFWLFTLLEFENLRRLYSLHRDSITRGSPLPKEIDDALGAFEIVLVHEMHKRSRQLLDTMTQRPGFSHMYHHSDV